jgi:hypothetical protein
MPGPGTVCVWSSPVDDDGNSTAGIAAVEEFARLAGGSVFATNDCNDTALFVPVAGEDPERKRGNCDAKSSGPLRPADWGEGSRKMTIRVSATCAFGVVRLAFDAGAAFLSVALAVPASFAAGEARSMAHTARSDIAPTAEHHGEAACDV